MEPSSNRGQGHGFGVGTGRIATGAGRKGAILDTRVQGKLTKKLLRVAKRYVDSDDILEAADVAFPRGNGTWTLPDCVSCTDRCCIHPDRTSGILLSLRDVANLVDSGMGDLIVGTFTFKKDKKRKGRYRTEIDQMPRLAKKDGDCVFYDSASGRCTGYGTRPTICRRYPFEVDYKKRDREPFARFIPWAECPRIEVEGPQAEAAVQQMVADAIMDENISFEDAMLLPDALDELREAGFGRYLPPPEECPRV